MLCPTLKLVTVLVLLPAIFGLNIEYSRIRKAVGGYTKQQRGTKGVLRHYLRFRNIPPKSLQLSAGESKVLECEAGGIPPPTIHWLKDGRRFDQHMLLSNEVDDGNRDTTPPLGLSSTRSRLYLDCATEQDVGEYTCVADNPYFRISTKTKVELVDQGKSSEVFCLTKKSYGIPARIQMWTHTRLELMGTDVQLFCRVAGMPEPKVEWLNPDDVPIQENAKYQILSNGDLIIRKIDWNDMGGYICISKNVHGSDETSTFLYPTAPEK